MRRARAAGLDVIALTDHDTLAGQDEARRALPDGLTLVTGMELSARLDSQSVHLLSYLPSGASPELAAECQAIRADRVRRGQAMVGRLRDLGVDVTWEQVAALAAGGSPTRPSPPWPERAWPAWKLTSPITTRRNGPGSGFSRPAWAC